MRRRELLPCLSAGAALSGAPAWTQQKPVATPGLPPLKITNIKTILTAPNRIRPVVVSHGLSVGASSARWMANRELSTCWQCHREVKWISGCELPAR